MLREKLGPHCIFRAETAPGVSSFICKHEGLHEADHMNTSTLSTAEWVKTVIHQDEIDRYLNNGDDFIDDAALESLIVSTREPSREELSAILDKSKLLRTLTLEDVARLMAVQDPEMREEMVAAASAIKHRVYDNRIVTFAPLYLSNRCVNSCTYCGFRQGNEGMVRRKLTMEEVRQETEALCRDFGHKRLVVVYGEHPESDVDYMIESINSIYQVNVATRKGEANIRRVNVNAAPLSISKLKKLNEVGMGTYQVFQETYHRKTYEKVHPGSTLKGNFRWRLYCMHRAMEAGIEDVGIGVLFGLYDWRFEVLGLVSHALDLEQHFGGTGPHTLSFPRLEAAMNAPYLADTKYRVSDEDFLHILTVLRLSVPYAGMICTAREPAPIRMEAVKRGITQMDASTRIGLGAYSDRSNKQEIEKQQFMLGDNRSLEELIGDLADAGHITSFCTAGYRTGRTGETIQRMLRDCSEGHFCKLNAIITFREWLDDFASPSIREKCEALIQKELASARGSLPQFMPSFEPLYKKTLHGCRDLFL